MGRMEPVEAVTRRGKIHRSQSYLRATPSVTTIRTPWRCLSPLFQGRIVLLFGILF